MSSSRKVWIPGGAPPEAEMALSVEPPRRPMTPALYRSLLVLKLDSLIQADPQAARSALEMSQEQAPELYLIAQNQPIRQWPQSLMSSDSMHSLLSRLDWTMPGKVQSLPQHSDLQSLLEQLP